VFLQQRAGLFRRLPRFLDRVLDHPALLRWVGARGVETSAVNLGDLTLSMLQGSAGFQRKEVQRLTDWLTRPPRPDLLLLTNILIAGCVPDLKAALQVPVAVTLQGDDLFLEELPPEVRSRAGELIRRLADHVDAFLVHSRFYADFMADYLGLDRAKFHCVPLGIDTSDFADARASTSSGPPDAPSRIGYLARLAPEKGLHVLVEAFLELKRRPGMGRVQLVIAGWRGKRHESYVQTQMATLRDAGWAADVTVLGTVDRAAKLQMLSRLDLFSVPTTFQEPKGLSVLEAMAAGVPVVQPAHGIFPELLAATGGGLLVPPNSPAALAAAWEQLLRDPEQRQSLGAAGRAAVAQKYGARVAADQTLAVLRNLLPP